jgi:AcrR family transcriptional regulator
MMARKREDIRLDRDAWIQAALGMLEHGSIENVRVEPLAKALGVTKGSFYWHFKDRDEFLQGILDTWRQWAVSKVIERLERQNEDAQETIRQVLQLSSVPKNVKRAQLIELAIRGWARRDKQAARAVAEVDEQRIRFSTRLFQRMGLDEEQARARAFLVYCFNHGDALSNNGQNQEDREATRRICIDFLSKV